MSDGRNDASGGGGSPRRWVGSDSDVWMAGRSDDLASGVTVRRSRYAVRHQRTARRGIRLGRPQRSRFQPPCLFSYRHDRTVTVRASQEAALLRGFDGVVLLASGLAKRSKDFYKQCVMEKDPLPWKQISCRSRLPALIVGGTVIPFSSAFRTDRLALSRQRLKRRMSFNRLARCWTNRPASAPLIAR